MLCGCVVGVGAMFARRKTKEKTDRVIPSAPFGLCVVVCMRIVPNT